MVAGVAISVFLLVLLLRVGVVAEYGGDGFEVRARVGVFLLRVYPGKEQTEAEKQRKAAKKDIKKAKKKLKEKKPGGLKGFIDMLPAVKKALSRLRRKLLIRRLTVHYTAAGADPAGVAMAFGASNAVFSLIIPFLDSSFRIKRRDIRTTADFESGQQSIYVCAAFSLAVWEVLYIASALSGLISKKTARDGGIPARKEVRENG